MRIEKQVQYDPRHATPYANSLNGGDSKGFSPLHDHILSCQRASQLDQMGKTPVSFPAP